LVDLLGRSIYRLIACAYKELARARPVRVRRSNLGLRFKAKCAKENKKESKLPG
jgi:hypothetical protein